MSAKPGRNRFRRSTEHEPAADRNRPQLDPDETALFCSPAPSSLPRKYKCKYCGQRFRTRSNLNLHAYVHSRHRREDIMQHRVANSGQYKCRRCGRQFTSKALRNEHEFVRHQYPFICTSCHKRYSDARYLIRHVHIRHPEEITYERSPVVSPQTAARTAEAVSAELELTSSPSLSPVHSPSAQLPPISPPAPRPQRPNNIQNNANQNNSDQQSNFQAQVLRANEIFKRTSQPTVAKRKGVRERKPPSKAATGSKPKPNRFQCDLCPKEYVVKQYLVIHRRTHFGDFSFVCEYCQRGFTTSANLDVHIRIHTGEKPFQCTLCQKTFVQKVHMINHLRKTHNQPC